MQRNLAAPSDNLDQSGIEPLISKLETDPYQTLELPLISKLKKHLYQILELPQNENKNEQEKKDEAERLIQKSIIRTLSGYPIRRSLANLLFYFTIGFWLVPGVKLLTFILEFIPKAIEVSLDHASKLCKEKIRTPSRSVAYTYAVASKILSGLSSIFKGLWYIGRCITSPVTTYKAIKNTARDACRSEEVSQSRDETCHSDELVVGGSAAEIQIGLNIVTGPNHLGDNKKKGSSAKPARGVGRIPLQKDISKRHEGTFETQETNQFRY